MSILKAGFAITSALYVKMIMSNNIFLLRALFYKVKKLRVVKMTSFAQARVKKGALSSLHIYTHAEINKHI